MVPSTHRGKRSLVSVVSSLQIIVSVPKTDTEMKMNLYIVISKSKTQKIPTFIVKKYKIIEIAGFERENSSTSTRNPK